MTKERYFTSGDGSGHEYYVPAAKIDEWYEWLNISSEDEASWEAPEYAHRINGRLTFTDPHIE